MEQLENKREALRAALSDIQSKKEQLESAVETMKGAIASVLGAEMKEAEELQQIAAEFQDVSLQQTVDRLVDLKTQLAEAIQPVVVLASTNNEFAAQVMSTIEQSAPMIDQIKLLFGDLDAQLASVQGTLDQIGLGQMIKLA